MLIVCGCANRTRSDIWLICGHRGSRGREGSVRANASISQCRAKHTGRKRWAAKWARENGGQEWVSSGRTPHQILGGLYMYYDVASHLFFFCAMICFFFLPRVDKSPHVALAIKPRRLDRVKQNTVRGNMIRHSMARCKIVGCCRGPSVILCHRRTER